MILTRILTKKLTSFWLMSLAGVAFICFITAMFSFFQLTYAFQQQKVSELESMLQQQFAVNIAPEERWELNNWLPPLLHAYQAESFVLSKDKVTLFEYRQDKALSAGVRYSSKLEHGLKMELVLPQPFNKHEVSAYEWMILVVGCIAVMLFVRFGFRWFSEQLNGIEDLAQRANLILTGQRDKALAEKGHGRPRMINRAMTQLLLELYEAHKERARFDQFIRSNTFLDAETGIGNRLFLKNRLDALSNSSGMMTPGGFVSV